jgi:dTDP-4-amino-4,6-dideoxygalactose transaminase
MLSNHGPYVEELERRIADMLGVRHCIAMCNGTVALEIAIRAIGLTVKSSSPPLRSLPQLMLCNGRR